jgi:hypothetical protein
MDPDYPELPLGGWAGKIADVQREAVAAYLVRWNADTLKSVHPIYGDRCRRDDLSLEQTWLLEADLEADRGEQRSIQHPTNIAAEAEITSQSQAG